MFFEKKSEKDQHYYQAYLAEQQISRRGLFTSIVKGVQQSRLPQDIDLWASPRQAPRPPFAAPEPIFIQRCDGCGQCKQACPEYVIDIEQGRAQLNLDYNHCQQCFACVKACPSQALSAEFRADTGYRPQFNRCRNQINRSQCQVCLQACPQQALQLDAQHLPLLEGQQCLGCGQCKSACTFACID